MNSEAPDFQVAVPMSEVARGSLHACNVGGREVLICHIREGVFAVDNICTHAHARMDEGRMRGTKLVCPLHGASFDVRDGRVLAGPAVIPLPHHAVRIVDGMVEVALDPDAPPQLSAD